MQLAYLEGHDPSVPIGKNAERQDGLHAEGIDRFQTPLVPDEHRIVDSVGVGVFTYFIRIIDRNADNFEVICCMFATEGLQQRDLSTAGIAPGCPEINYERTVLE